MKSTNSTDIRPCPNCSAGPITTRVLPDRFMYGAGKDQVELEAQIPFHKCENCGFEFTAADAEDLRHEAVCRHLNVHSPAEIVALREKYGVTQDEFARLTRFGSASLSRWETAQLIQNGANDQLLYLLQFDENVERLATRGRAAEAPSPALAPRKAAATSSKALRVNEAQRCRAQVFQLRYRRRA
jgi:putative zinc finger/helix-turn-helix YgiT family protein